MSDSLSKPVSSCRTQPRWDADIAQIVSHGARKGLVAGEIGAVSSQAMRAVELRSRADTGDQPAQQCEPLHLVGYSPSNGLRCCCHKRVVPSGAELIPEILMP